MAIIDTHQQLYFAGKSLAEFGITISGPSVYNAPATDVDRLAIPGRHGDLIIPHDRYEMIEVSYHCNMIFEDLPTQTAALREWLYKKSSQGLCDIRDTYNPNEHREGIFVGPLEIEPGYMHKWAEFDLIFLCKPQRYLLESPVITVPAGSSAALNPGSGGGAWRAEPYIEVFDSGTIELGGAEFDITIDTEEKIVIDCEAMAAYDEHGTLCNNKIGPVYYWPKIQGGETIENHTAAAIKVYPRWWML